MQKRLYSLRLSVKRMRKGKPHTPSRIRDNSTPFIEQPRTLEDAIRISDSVANAAGEWKIKL